ncbi:putative dimethyl sulfoxide reductase chain YnfE [Aliiroseovarius sp. xm-m-379]|uniref:molybdopterin-dependent oxidoreductase n=1 Tax=unclassified Aliiroseovarius TaxID=2623558 RepID=UPI001568A48C|nr:MULTISPECIES: molybdopterin-dependent oxidoreductase [unclassified Aliiroseovarius]NRP25092.1 putative dimethyl sulfoxide reductase chain YnfE [Aliiroseovarius sp. xm-m-379]NRP31387.1 putative dimethyl sulfoxide reductase chain YnfE [Aliiroseovarius sp. xm-m-314]NRP33891.1 putative dimethyl sulfoxide reductase chain YnfE [Aliiroseovarius sp. xm-a-104]NRP45379.1 putative dimethyl sulfoxide reductase chain YnfE [Aliiroseovarius sp. xm-m-378]NRP50570.1 putative dimethyl sulfoxide reductase cha
MSRQTDTLSLPSVCPLDCPDTCSLSARVQGDQLLGVKGSKANPYTDGVICNKVARYYPEFVHGKARLTRPLRRVGARGEGRFERISWDTALDLIHDGFTKAITRHGPETILPFNYAGPHGELAGGSMDRRFFYHMGATLLNRGPLCGGVRGGAYASLFGNAPGMPPEQVLHSDLVLVWGNNVTVSNLHLAPVLKKMRASGGKLVVIDPKRTKIAEQCDLHIQIRPNTDVVFAMALAAELERQAALDVDFIAQWVEGGDRYLAQARTYSIKKMEEICGIPAHELQTVIDMIKAARNMACALGNGIERGRSGGSGLRAAMALNALTGHHGRRGAGVVAKSGLATPKNQSCLHGDHLLKPGTRVLNIVDLGAALQDRTLAPPITAAMIYNHNPVATHPDQSNLIRGLMREDLFLAGCDVTMTDSMALCDVILPAATHFEHDDLFGAYGQNYLQRAEPVIPPVGEALPNTEIFRRLAARFGYDDPVFKASDQQLMDEALLSEHPQLQGTKGSALPTDRALEMRTNAGDDMIMCQTVTPQTASGKIELFSRDLEDRFGFGVPRYDPCQQDLPFVLISPSSDKRTNSTFGGLDASRGPEQVEMHPSDAARRGLQDGELLSVFNHRAEVTLTLKLTDSTLPGVLYSPKGTWRATSQTGLTVNALIPADQRTDIEDGACYHETYVDVRQSERTG